MIDISDLPDPTKPRPVDISDLPAPPPPKAPDTSRTFGQAATDIGAGLVSGVGGAAKFVPQMYGLATGDFSDTGVMAIGNKLQQYGEEMKSPGLKAREQLKEEKVKEAEKSGQLSALGREALETIKDPFGLGLNFIAQQLPEQLPAIIAAIAAPELSPAVAASRAAARKAVGTAAEKAAAEAAQAAAVKSGARAAIGTGALQQGSDVGAQVYKATYDKMIADGVPEDEAKERALKYARATGVAGAAISLGAQNLPGGHRFAEALAGKAGKAGRLRNAAGLALGELPSEEIEEVGGQLAQNVAQQQVDPNAELTENLGRTAAQAGIGAIGTAGGMGLLQKPAAAQKPGTTPPAPPAAPETPPATPPVNPPTTPPGNVAPGANPDLSQHFENYHQGLPDASSTVFQNRDRSTDASIQQMQGVAANPRYNDLSISRSFGSGAPVVMTDEKLNENQLGNYEMTTASDGTKIPVRYAVVDAHELLPSHSHDGTKNAEYQDLSVSAIRPVAGNGRVAGIQEAYQRGTAGKYKEELVNDAAHGIDPKTIADMKQPVLVRVMPKSFITPNIGDISNVSGISGLSAIDSAKQDANRIDINSLKFYDNGDPHIDSLRDFVNAMPVSEHPDLKDLFGQPSKKAEDRLMNAVFWKAYGNEQLINLYGPTRDAESRLVLNSLGTVAPKMAQLDGAGEYDIRPYVTQAAEAAVNARRRNIPLEDMAKQMDIGTNPYTQRILQMFADSGRSGKKITEGLNNLANAALEEHNRTDTDMFGEVPKRSLDEVFKKAFEGEKDLFTPPDEPPTKDTFFQKPQLSKAELLKRLNGKNIVEAAQILVDIAHDSYHKGIAEHILRKVQEFDRRGVPMTFSTKYVMNKKRSSLGRVFSPSGLGKINFIMEINGEKGSTFEVLAHEFIHLISLAEIKFLGTDNPLVKELDDLRKLVHKQWRKDKKEGKYIRDEFSINYAFKKSTGVEGDFYAEFITQGLTDPAMQKYLAGIKVGNKTALDKLMEFVRKVLNLSPEYETALDRLIRISTDMFENPALEIAKDLEKKGYTLGVPTTPQAPPGRLKSNPKMTAEESPIQPSQATGAGRDALDSLRDMGREVEEQPKSFYENLKSYWDNAIDNPGMAIEDAKKAATKFSDKIQTWIFSSDSAFNNNIKRGIMQADGEMSDKVRNRLNISTSQAVGADIVANGALLDGKLGYDDDVQKWEVVKDRYNLKELIKSISEFANKYNMTYQEAELVTHMAFEARRTQSLKDFNASIASAPEEIEALNELLNSLTGNDPDTKAQRAEVKAAISRFENLAKQKPKLIHLSDEQIATGLDFFKSMPELQDTVDIWQGMRNNAKDALVESGLWSEEYAEQMMSNIDYVPFQREFEEEEAKGGDKNYLSGLMVKAREFKMTGSERPVANIVDNMAKWIEYSYNRSIRNSQAKAMIDTAMSKDLESLGIAKKIPHPIKNANVVRIWRDGKEEFYDMKDPLFVDAFAGIQAVSVPTVKFFSKFANILRESVVMNPLFAVSQVPQDAFSAIFTSGLSPQYALRIPALAAKEFVKTLRRTSTTHEELKKYRAVGYTDFTSDLARRDAEVYAGVKPPPGGWGQGQRYAQAYLYGIR